MAILSGLPGISVGIGVDATGVATGLRVAENQISRFGQTATRSTGQMRQGFQQAGFQIQDFVVQVTSGTSAMRAFAQQAPQMLGAFGPQGAVIGTVVALVAGLGTAFLASRDAAAQTAELNYLDSLVGRPGGSVYEFLQTMSTAALSTVLR